MYAGSSISVAAIVEHLMNMTRDLEDLAHLVWTLTQGEPRIEAIEKAYRQEVVPRKEKSEEMKAKLFEFMASGRIEIVEYSSFYLMVAMSLEKAAQSLDAAAYRMILLAGAASRNGEAMSLVASQLEHVKSALGHLLSALRVVQSMSASNEKYRMLEQKIGNLKAAEEDADKVYRKLLAYAITEYKDNCSALIILKDLAESVEDSMDYIAEAGDYVRALGVALYSR